MANGSKNTVFAGAGCGEGKNAGRYRGGLFRLRPGAAAWEAVTGGLPADAEVRTIARHPKDPQTLFIGTQDGPYRSADGGETWQKPNFPDKGAVIWTVGVHPTRPEIVYAGAAPVALYRSEDGGDSWKRVAGATSPAHCERDGFDTRTIRIAFNPARPDEVYVGLEVSGVLRSADGGETWIDVSAPLIELAQLPHLQSNVGGRHCGHCEGMLDTHALAVSSAAPGAAFLAVRMGIFRTDDGGASWQDTEVGRFSPLTYCRDLIVSPHDPSVFYAALSRAAFSTAGSFFRSDDVAKTWQRIDHGVRVESTVMALASHPTDPASLYGVTRGGQVIGTEDDGATWQDRPLPKDVHDVYAVACT